MTDPVDPGFTPEDTTPTGRTPGVKRIPSVSRKFAAAGLAAGLLGGGAAGLVLSSAPISGAAGVTSTQSSSDSTSEDSSTDAEDRAELRKEHLDEVLKPLVDGGTINADQADAVIQALLDAAPERLHGHGGHGPVRMRFDAAANAIGIEPSELADAVRSGSTIAEVAAEHGVDAEVVIDAMVAEATDQLKAAVDEGRITQDQMDKRLETLVERTTDRVNNGKPDRGSRGEKPADPAPGTPEAPGTPDTGGN